MTPLLDCSTLDINGLRNLIEHLLEGGVHGLFLLGTNGEGASLDLSVRKQVIRESCKIVNGRVPVLVGISDTAIATSLEISDYAKTCGADALVVAPPYYFPISQEEMQEYLKVLVPQLQLPFLLYNIPSCTKLSVSVATVKLARDLGAIGIKDSSGDWELLSSIIEAFKDDPDFSIIAGAEILLPETIAHGGHGAVAGGANIFPKLFVDLYNASISGNTADIKVLKQKVQSLQDGLYSIGTTDTKSIKAIKCTLSIMGICGDYMAPPLHNFDTLQRERVVQWLDGFKSYYRKSVP